jgi:outer membrane protein OmpA-like peptidoglycan-associated protein
MPSLLLSIRTFVIVLLLMEGRFANGQTNLLRNGGFEQIELDTNIYLWANSEATQEPLNDTAIGWNSGKRQMVLIYCLDWNFGSYGWHSNMTYYTDSGYSRTGKCFGLIMPYTIEPNQRLDIQNLCGKLCTPLVAGHKYKVSFYLKAYEGNIFTNQISVAFSETYPDNSFMLEKEDISKTGTEVPLTKAYTVPGILDNKEYKQFQFEYAAKGNEDFIYIGNFHLGYILKENCRKTEGFGLYNLPSRRPYIQYAIDDIVVEPLDFSEKCDVQLVKKVPTVTITRDTLKLQSIYFDYNDTISANTFTKIADTLKLLASCNHLLVYGYTDNAGSLEYNQRLSEQRAVFVAKKLNGLTDKNIAAKGEGLSKDNVEPRLQRRVDIYVVK